MGIIALVGSAVKDTPLWSTFAAADTGLLRVSYYYIVSHNPAIMTQSARKCTLEQGITDNNGHYG